MKRSKHSLSHYRLTTLNQGKLFPVGCLEVLPGDTFRHSSSVLLRVSPLVSPVMHPVHVAVHHWFVPSRILWDGWEDFITGIDTETLLPTVSVTSADTGAVALAQALGVGYGTTTVALNALPFRAYNSIWNEFYRDQDLNTPAVVDTGNTDTADNYDILNVSWEKDYFTTARPYAQQGEDTQLVELSLSGFAPVIGIGKQTQTYSGSSPAVYETGASGTRQYTDAQRISDASTDEQTWIEEDPDNAGFPNIRADLSGIPDGSVNMSIDDWRRAMAMQRIREHRNRFGSRYRDYLAFLGIRSSDARLQRPEYLGGGKQTVAFSEVLSTADTGNAVVGDLAGHGIAALRTRPYRRFFEEHGYVLSLMSVRPKTVYQSQIPRTFLRREYTDFWQKELEMLGEQEVTNVEVYADAAEPNSVFGYVPRHDDYRHLPSFVSGEFRSLLDFWHMARQFDSQPALNGSFVSCVPTDRIYASTDTDELYAMVAHRLAARRLVSKRARN